MMNAMPMNQMPMMNPDDGHEPDDGHDEPDDDGRDEPDDDGGCR